MGRMEELKMLLGELRARAEGSGFWRLLGMRVGKVEEGKAELALTVSEEMMEPDGTASKGVIASLIDSAVGVAVATRLEPGMRPVTVQLKVSFLLPVKRGDLRAVATVVHQGEDVSVGIAEVKDESGRLVACGMATYLVSEARRSR